LKIQILSDLHLEHSQRHPPLAWPSTDAEVVVLAGDIDNGTRAIDWAEQTFAGKTVLYVPGNHEYYEAELDEAAAARKARAHRSSNVRLLDNEEFVSGGVRFLGSTLWTDFALSGEHDMPRIFAESLKYVVDFRLIRKGNGLLTPQQTIDLHRRAIAFLQTRLDQPCVEKTVIITHHAPHPESVHPRFARSPVNPAFVSDLSRLMGKPALWIHGHTHNSFDYTVCGTRVIANPMGYRTTHWAEPDNATAPTQTITENSRFDPALVIEI
jgi:Icc-related predicted phosphoesterase